MDLTRYKRRRIGVIALASGVALIASWIAPQAAQADPAPPDPVVIATSETVSGDTYALPDEGELDGLTDVTGAWYIEDDQDGTYSFTTGPGITSVPEVGKNAPVINPDSISIPMFSATVCTFYVGATYYQPLYDRLAATTRAGCNRSLAEITAQAYFQRRVAVLFWTRFSLDKVNPDLGWGTLTSTFTEPCHTGSGGHYYRLKGRFWTSETGITPWWTGNKTVKLYCGT